MKTLFNEDANLTEANLPQGPENPNANTRRQRYNTIIRRTIIRNKKGEHYNNFTKQSNSQ